MKFLLRISLLLLALTSAARAGNDEDFAAVRRADQRRIVATISNNIAQLGEVLSENLRYAQADGMVLSKAQLLAAVAQNKTHYVSARPENVQFEMIAAGVVTMDGRAEIVISANGQEVHLALHFLEVWRNESGQWRLVAYQSGPLPNK